MSREDTVWNHTKLFDDVTIAKHGKRVLAYCKREGIDQVVTGYFTYDENKGAEIFIPDSGGKIPLWEVPCWCEIPEFDIAVPDTILPF